MPQQSYTQIFCCVLFLYVLPILYILHCVTQWASVSTCFQRILLVNSSYVIYLRFANPGHGGFVVDMFQILCCLWIVENFNYDDSQLDASCTDSGENYFLYLSDVVYQSLLYLYTLSCAFFLLFVVVVIIYVLLDHYYITPRRLRNRGLRDNEFDDLPLINYQQGTGENTLCSICLNDFEVEEQVLQLPECHHLFHRECIRVWLGTHLDCPYCRSNVRDQLTRTKRLIGPPNADNAAQNNNNNNNENNQQAIELESRSSVLSGSGMDGEEDPA